MTQTRQFAELPTGWHYGQGAAIKQPVIDAALEVIALLMKIGASTCGTFPAVNGEILVAGYFGNEVLDIRCLENGMFDIEFD